jgi:hypothetical protein
MKTHQTMNMIMTMACLTGALFLAALRPAQAADESGHSSEGKGRTEEREVHQVATISAIDKTARTVTLTDEQGEKHEVDVPKSMKSFDKLKIGQKVSVDYYESLAVSLDKSGTGGPGRAQQEQTQALPATAEHGPGRVRMKQSSVTAEVVAVDAAKHKVTLKGPDGNTRTIDVKDPAIREKLPSVKPGDNVDVVYTEAVAARLMPMPEKK